MLNKLKKLEKLNKVKENKTIKTIGTILYVLLVIFVVMILLVTLIQRVSKNNISLGGIRIFNIITESMLPKYEVGDILVSKAIEPSKIKIGDDLVYKGEKSSFKDKIITHQVINIEQKDGKYMFHTKGLANEEADPIVSEEQIYGTIIYKTIFLSFIGKIINNIYLFYFLIFVPIAIWIVLKIRLLIKESKEDDEQNKSANSLKKKEKIEIKKSQKKNNIIKIFKKIKPRTIIILIVLLTFNSYAWFIYATRVSSSIRAHVTAWDVKFEVGEHETITNLNINLGRIYPGMDTYVQEITVHNSGEMIAELSYEINSITILGATYTVGEQYTSQNLIDMIETNYPFSLSVVIDDTDLMQTNGTGSFVINVEWPFESGDDATDTHWGEQAYQYYSVHPGEDSLRIELVLIAEQAEA